MATALTQSLATTGVSTMTAPLVAAAGLVTTPSYTFTGALHSGFYLAGADQIGWASAGVLGATFNNDQSVTFNGTISANKGTVPIGAVMDYAGATAPNGWLLCFGQLISTTTYAALFAALSTTYGSGSGTFGIPDYRGRGTIGKDNMGGSAAGRITAAVNYDGTILGNSGGAQSTTLGTTNLPPYTPAGSTAPNAGGLSPLAVANGSGATLVSTIGGSPVNVYTIGTFNTLTVPFTGSAQGGASTPLTNLLPSIITNKIIYAGV